MGVIMSVFPKINPWNKVVPLPDVPPDYHAVTTIQLCELVNSGYFNLGGDGWEWSGLADIHIQRLSAMITKKYYWHDIGILPASEWKQRFLYRLTYELAPKYAPLYKNFDIENIDLLQISRYYEKERTINSSYPETLINDKDGAYASFGEDREEERVTEGDYLERMLAILNTYKSLDTYFCDEMGIMFSSLLTIGISGY